MATATYTAGTWLGVLRSRTAVFLGPGTPPALVQSLWDLLEDEPEVHEVLHAVTSSFGVSLARSRRSASWISATRWGSSSAMTWT